MATRTFASLDGLRAIAILAVIWHHTASRFFYSITIAGRGPMGVNLFFVISGFLITTLLLRERQRTGDISIRNFIIRRALRIFPVYYTVLLVYTALVLVVERGSPGGTAFMHNLVFYVTYTSNWFVPLSDARVIFYFAWSLAVEEQFYFVWPWIEKKMGWHLASLTIVLLFTLFAWLDVNVFACILMGVAMAHVLHHSRSHAWVFFLGARGMPVAGAGLVILSLAVPGVPEYLIYLALALFVSTCVIREDHWLAPVLQFKPLVAVGQVSYGLYLLHMLSCNVVKRAGGAWISDQPLVLFVATAAVAFVVAWISYRYFESYFLRFKKRFS
jgi:peptidoglycan/LPS O-acetylase OafA/YrhL